jgi:shikimate kinase
MGSGKTTVGRLLARQVGWHFVDLDSRIEESAGLTITAIFERLGEPGFRDIEHEELVRALGEAAEREKAVVVALGGGTTTQPRNLELLRATGSVIVWLDWPIETLLARCGTRKNRPLFRDEKSFRELFELRRPFYEQSDYRLACNSEPWQVVSQILALGILEQVNA